MEKDMKKRISICLLYLFFLFSYKTFSKGFFYEVFTDSSKVYLYGSIHLGKKSFYPLEPIVENTFKDCKNVVFEINIKQVSPLEIFEYGIFKDTSTLENSIPQKYFKKMDSLFKHYSIPKILYNKLQPWMAVLLLVSLEALNQKGNEYIEGIEMYFANKLDSTKNVLELESFVEQLEIFKSLYQLAPEYFLDYFLFQEQASLMKNENIFEAWEKGDENALIDKITVKNYSDTLEVAFHKLLNENRNFKMVDKISQYLSDKECYFVIVGSAHLFGEKGIINLLKTKGYRLKKIL